MDFRIVKKGYDTKETKDYILKITKEKEEEQAKNKAIITTLKDRISALSDKIKEMETQKKMVSLSLLKAVEKAEEIESIAKKKSEEELASLKIFHLRWKSYYKRLIEKYPFDEELRKSREFTKKIDDVFILPNKLDKDALDEFLANSQGLVEQKGNSENTESIENVLLENAKDLNDILSQIETDL